MNSSTVLNTSPLLSSVFQPTVKNQNSSVTNFSLLKSPFIVEKSPLAGVVSYRDWGSEFQTNSYENGENTNKDLHTKNNPDFKGMISFEDFQRHGDSSIVNRQVIITKSFFESVKDGKNIHPTQTFNSFFFSNQDNKKEEENNDNSKNKNEERKTGRFIGKNEFIRENSSIFCKTKELFNNYSNSLRKSENKTINFLGSFIKLQEQDTPVKSKKPSDELRNNYMDNIIRVKYDQNNSANLMRKKRGRKPLHNKAKPVRPKKIKKKDTTKIILYLNNFTINKKYLESFPLIPLTEEEATVIIFQRMLTEENYFIKNDQIYSETAILSSKKYSSKNSKVKLKKEFEELTPKLYQIDENKDVTDPFIIIKNYYTEIQKTIYLIQKNFIGKKKRILNEEQCKILDNLITSCNTISNTLLNTKKVSIKNDKTFGKEALKKNKTKKNSSLRIYKCPLCYKPFEKGQGLGGHMSRLHPGSSEKYKMKMNIRSNRESDRRQLVEIKEKFYKEFNSNFEELPENDRLYEVQKFINAHDKEFKVYKLAEFKKIKKQKQLLIQEEEKYSKNSSSVEEET